MLNKRRLVYDAREDMIDSYDTPHSVAQPAKVVARAYLIVIFGFLLYAVIGLCLTVISAPALSQALPAALRDAIALCDVMWLVVLLFIIVDFRATPFVTTLKGSVLTTYSLTGKRQLDLEKVGLVRAVQPLSNSRAGVAQARTYNIWLSDGSTRLNLHLGIIPRKVRAFFYQPTRKLLQRLEVEKGSPVSFMFAKWFSYYDREQAALLVGYMHGDV